MIQEQLFLNKLAQLLDFVFVPRDILHLTLKKYYCENI